MPSHLLSHRSLLLALAFCLALSAPAQQITGLWKGRIDGQRVELKIIKTGDSLTGTSYYYTSAANYRRYSIKGYFDPNSNAAVWWDDRLIEERSGRLSLGNPGGAAMLSTADFNCPGGGVMLLDGSSGEKDRGKGTDGPVHLQKTTAQPVFPDEWDFVIDNYTVGANDPELIDSIALVAFRPTPDREQTPRPSTQPPIARNPVPGTVRIPFPKELPPVKRTEPPRPEPARPSPPVARTPPPVSRPALPPTIEEKFTSRQKIFTTQVPVSGDSIELRFYDNAEIDGDSISLFLDGRLLFAHIRLTDRAYVIKLAVADLKESSELVMVAENLGSIPPNTSYMVALSGGQRFEARLASTENSSAMIRLTKTAAGSSSPPAAQP